jgi:transcriptional regulator with XRE-family HTH domain
MISEKIETTKAGIAQKLGLKTNTFSEILNNRMNVGTDIVSILCETYNISSDWLLTGRGEMLQRNNIGHYTSGNNNPISGNIEIQTYKLELDLANIKISYLERIIEDKEELIQILKNEHWT